jgi:cytochrome P450
MSLAIAEVQAPGPEQPFDLDANEESLSLLQEFLRRYGDICRVRPVTRTADSLVTHDPDHIRRVLLTNRRNYVKGVGIERVRVLLGNGLMASEGDFWMRQRRMIQPAFHSRVTRQFSELIRSATLELLARWADRAVTGEAVNLTREMSDVTLKIVLRALLGTDLDRLIESTGANPFDLLTRESQRDLDFATRFRALTRIVRQVIGARRREPRAHFDLLAMLMEARDKETGDPMPDRALVDEIMTLIVAGHETTASALNWTWYLLSQHPDVEAALHREVAAAPPPEALTVEDATRISYVQQVLKESLRLYPPGWLFNRRAIAEDRLGDFHVPAGTNIFICPYLLHRHARHWANPDDFRPERFAAARDAARHDFAFLPFSAGPRHCVGEGFAMAEMAMHVTMVARRFRLEYSGAAPPEPEFQINLRTRRDLEMQVVTR